MRREGYASSVDPFEHRWLSNFASFADMRRALHASMHIPVFSRYLPYLYPRDFSTGPSAGFPQTGGGPDPAAAAKDKIWEVFDGVVSMSARHLAHGSGTLVISGVPWAAWPDSNFCDIATTLSPAQCLLPPSNATAAEELIGLGSKMAREWLQGGGRLKKKHRSVLTYRGILFAARLGFWCVRAAEETIVPAYARRPPKVNVSAAAGAGSKNRAGQPPQLLSKL